AKGSNERHSKRDACITGNAPHKQTKQMSQTLNQFRPASVPITLTTDNFLLKYRAAIGAPRITVKILTI
ncbi:MAG: hypothetical protein ABJQ70_06185, partial [Roseobacter sp.]